MNKVIKVLVVIIAIVVGVVILFFAYSFISGYLQGRKSAEEIRINSGLPPLSVKEEFYRTVVYTGRERLRDINRKTQLEIYRASLGYYFKDKGAYPDTNNVLVKIKGAEAKNNTPCKELFSILKTSSGFSCPVDPLDPSAHLDSSGQPDGYSPLDPSRFYGYRSDGQSFELSAVLEDPKCEMEGALKDGNYCMLKISN